MNLLERLLGQKSLRYLFLIIISVFLIVLGDRFISSEGIGVLLIIISVSNLIYELKLRYYIKIKKDVYNFKSNKEIFIASYLDKKKIKYIYEKELKLGKDKIHPDFFLPEFDVYVEYWGKWPGDFDYRKECNYKRKMFEKYDINLLELYPDNLLSINKLDWKFTERLLNLLKKERT